jgi:two-component system, LytTR family, sensor kinase
MKQTFLLLLALTCFRFSYSEDLSPEKQQLAWNFIQDNLLYKDRRPNTFNSDIRINLKGEITSADSVFVKDLISRIQKAIPKLPIQLTDKPGNLVLEVINNNKIRITTNINYEKYTLESMTVETEILSSREREKFIYFHLLRVFTSGHKKQPVVGLNGCVFAENNFKAVTFSPFDMFILEKIYSPDFQSQMINNLDPHLKQTAWNSISAKFMGETKKPIIYRNDIAIKLEGTVNPVDSVIINELIGNLKATIPNRKIYLTKDNANLSFTFNAATGGYGTGTIMNASGYSIRSTNTLFASSSDSLKKDRKKILHYYLYRSLVKFSISRSESTEIIGSVFDEKSPENIDLNRSSFDSFILKTLYADDFQEQFKTNFIKRTSYRMYLIKMYHNELDLVFLSLGLLISIVILSLIIIKGLFKPHNWNWLEYNKQGLFLIAIGCIYLICIGLSDLKFDSNDLSNLQNLIIRAFIAVNLTYFIERIILKNRSLGSSKLFIYFLVTIFVLKIVSFPIDFHFLQPDTFFQLAQKYSELIPYILLISLARSLYIFLNDRYKSIINQKDVELAKMGELHKQAELQSLRAKINPHFLYNALNSIAGLATTDARKTEQMALALSDFFKYAINREQKQLNSLSEELNAIRTYLEIEKVRFGDRLNFEIDCNTELLAIQIPQLLIQPLVENAIKHGLSQITENGMIRIIIKKEDYQLIIRVYDNGPAFADGPLTGFGIQNTQERIALLYGSKASINWNNKPEKYIELSLPFVG